MPGGLESNFVLGDVLLGRNPTKLPSDIQKVTRICSPLELCS